ncbi:MAG: hypothetical protein GY760_07245 [Deltaproteobacteria bacterium]|nr:hypothetical protein [Deltaproteobacteria bacterium]
MKKILAGFLCLFFSLSAYAQNIEIFTGFDNLEVTIEKPPNTTFSISSDNQPGDYTFNFFENSDKFILVLSLYPQKTNTFNIVDYYSFIKERGENLLSQAKESNIDLKNITEKNITKGYYYLLTEKQPNPEYKYLIQGYIKFNYILGYFTFLSNENNVEDLFDNLNIYQIAHDKQKIATTSYFEDIKLLPSMVPHLNLQNIKHFYCQHQVDYYNQTELYEKLMSKLVEKYTQSFCSEEEDGTIFYYFFENNIEEFNGFLDSLFYGEQNTPSQNHPELFIIKDNYLVIFSYPYKSKTGKELFNIIKRKL